MLAGWKEGRNVRREREVVHDYQMHRTYSYGHSELFPSSLGGQVRSKGLEPSMLDFTVFERK